MINRMVLNVIKKYIVFLNDEVIWGGGDSLDRERVRDIIFEDNCLEWIN
jgi:hypothetical protein